MPNTITSENCFEKLNKTRFFIDKRCSENYIIGKFLQSRLINLIEKAIKSKRYFNLISL